MLHTVAGSTQLPSRQDWPPAHAPVGLAIEHTRASPRQLPSKQVCPIGHSPEVLVAEHRFASGVHAP